MKVVTLRGIDDETFAAIKKASENFHTSMNRFLLGLIKEKFYAKTDIKGREFQEFLGSWAPREYRSFLHRAGALRSVDKELWA